MTTVARAFGQPFMAVMQAPYHETLLGFLGLQERERIDSLLDRARRTDDLFGMNAAFADGKRLDQRNRDLVADLRQVERVKPITKAEAQAIADEMLHRLATQTFVPVT